MKQIIFIMLLVLVHPELAARQYPLDTMCIVNGTINNSFGMVRNNGSKAHQGWDLVAKIGTKVYAIADSVVVEAKYHKDYGYYIVIKSHKSGYYYQYAHLSRFRVKEGMELKSGEVIAYTGRSGNARNISPDNYHLHFEMRLTANPGLGLAGRLSPVEGIGIPPGLFNCDLRVRGKSNE